MATKYDEDVYENPYFQDILSKHHEYIDKVALAKGILCVPQYSIAAHLIISVADIEDHILLPTNDIVDDSDDFLTVSGKTVQISDGKIITKEGFDALRQVSILFAETFHTDDGSSYRVFCTGGLLNKTIDVSLSSSSPDKAISPNSYQQCIDLLWSHSGGQRSREALNRMLFTYAGTYDRLEGESLRSIVDAANMHFTKSMQLMLKDSVVRRSARHNAHYMENLKVAVETYVMNAIHKPLFRVITATMAGHDAEINKVTRNLAGLQLSDMGIRKIFSQNIPTAKKELGLLNRYSTPMGRLFCIKRVVAALTRPPKQKNNEEETVMMTTDDLLPILIFLIIKSEIPNWMSNLVYMRHFHFAKSSDDDEFGFYLATVEAALEHIKSGHVKREINAETRERLSSVLIPDGSDLSNLSPASTSGMTRQQSQLSSIDEFFKYVQNGDEQKVRDMLEQPRKTSEEISLKLCHPLCSCDKCEKLLASLRNNSDLVTAYTRDNRGYTALHMAAYYGQGLLIDLLIQHNAAVNATDYLGLSPLHLACQRGYQNVMLLLLHFGADIMALDNENNTPLHLSCANGHEDCVKALVFYDASVRKLQVNAINELGDTPLHYAAKWGYESIVKALLENGADATMRNRKKQTPVSLAQNVKVQRWLQMAAEGLDLQPIRPQFVNQGSKSKSRSSSSSSNSHAHQLSNSIDQFEADPFSPCIETASLEEAGEMERRKQKEKLFKAIIEGDIQLVKFYLGETGDTSPVGEDDDDFDSSPVSAVTDASGMCHPLCQCHKCKGLQKVSQRSEGKLSVNVRTSTGYCPLHMAVLHNHSDIVELLISLGADTSPQNHKSMTPLHLACCMKNSLVTDMLIKAKANLNAIDMNGDTPLLIACSNGFLNGVTRLVQAGAKLNVGNTRGNTAVHEAVSRGHHDIVNLLIQTGADPRFANKQNMLPVQLTKDTGMRALLLATAFKLDEVETQLIEREKKRKKREKIPEKTENHNAGAKISIKDLFTAFEANDIETLQSLNASVRSFDWRSSLRRTKTVDKSSANLKKMFQAHSIKSFDKGTLRKVKSLDKADPIYVYSLQNSVSCFEDSFQSTRSGSEDMLFQTEESSSVHSFDSLESASTEEGHAEKLGHDTEPDSCAKLGHNTEVDSSVSAKLGQKIKYGDGLVELSDVTSDKDGVPEKPADLKFQDKDIWILCNKDGSEHVLESSQSEDPLNATQDTQNVLRNVSSSEEAVHSTQHTQSVSQSEDPINASQHTQSVSQSDNPINATQHTQSVSQSEDPINASQHTQSVSQSDNPINATQHTQSVSQSEDPINASQHTQSVSQSDNPINATQHTQSVSQSDNPINATQLTQSVSQSENPINPTQHTHSVSQPDFTKQHTQSVSQSEDTVITTQPPQSASQPVDVTQNTQTESQPEDFTQHIQSESQFENTVDATQHIQNVSESEDTAQHTKSTSQSEDATEHTQNESELEDTTQHTKSTSQS